MEKEIDALSGVSLEEEEEEKTDASAEDEEEEEDDADRATWVIDGRTFLTHHIPGMDGYDAEKTEIQGKQVRVLHNTVTDVYLYICSAITEATVITLYITRIPVILFPILKSRAEQIR